MNEHLSSALGSGSPPLNRRRWQLRRWLALVAGVIGVGLGLAACSQTSTLQIDVGAASPTTPGPDAAPSQTPVPAPTATPSPTATSTPIPSPTPIPPPWAPVPGTSFQWQLSGEIDTSIDVDAYDIDLFDAPAATIQELRNDGRKVICYFSAGSWEEWRSDAAEFPEDVLGEGNGWPGERWLDIRRIDVLAPLMQARLDLAVSKGCDAVEPDNVDAFQNAAGFDIDGDQQIAYLRWLADEAHRRGLSIGLKNAIGLIDQVVTDFDWALNERCIEFRECDLVSPFIEAGKAVFHVEYGGDLSWCPTTQALGFVSLEKDLLVGAEFAPCPAAQ
jgi:hypothetical protein